MKANNPCPKCGCKEIIRDAKAIDRGHAKIEDEFSVATFEHPEALIFKGEHRSPVSAYVCSRCGYVEFYADNAGWLKEAAH